MPIKSYPCPAVSSLALQLNHGSPGCARIEGAGTAGVGVQMQQSKVKIRIGRSCSPILTFVFCILHFDFPASPRRRLRANLPNVALILLAASSFAFWPCGARAQPPRRGAAARPPLVDAEVVVSPGDNDEPFAERLAREMWFLAKVGELNDEQSRSLLKEMTAIVQHRPSVLRVGSNQPLALQDILVEGRVHRVLVPTGHFLQEALRGKALSLLAAISPQAVRRIQAERERLDAFRRRASALVQIAVLDECLLLTSDQREKLCGALDLAENDAWWRPTNAAAMLDTAGKRLFDQLSGQGLGTFVISDAGLGRQLLPSQLALLHELRRPFVEQLVMKGGGAINGRQPPGAAVADDLVHRGSRLDDDLDWLSLRLLHHVDVLFLTCGLSRPQRQKLLLAGELDLDPLRERSLAQKRPDDQRDHIVVRVVSRGTVEMPPTIFDGTKSAFQKSLRRLTAEQQRLLRAAEDERRAFRRRAIVAAVVVSLAQGASLTGAQCEDVADALNDAVVSCPSANMERECLRAIGRLPDDTIRPLLADEQWPVAGRLLKWLALIALTIPDHALVLRNVRVVTTDKEGKVLSEFQAEELRLDADVLQAPERRPMEDLPRQ